MDVVVEVGRKYLTIRKGRRILIRTKVRRPEEVEEVLNMFPDERSRVAMVLALAMFRARAQEKALKMVRVALMEPSKRRLLLSFADYYYDVAIRFGRSAAVRVATALRSVLSYLP